MTKNPSWEEVKKWCRLNDDTIYKAKRLGMSPRTVRANFSSIKQEKWKTSTKDWIEQLYEKRYGKKSLDETNLKDRHDKIIRNQKQISNGYSNKKPSMTKDIYWIYSSNNLDNYPDTTERSGKWLIFEHISTIDDLWIKIQKALKEGKLGKIAKVSTEKPNPNAVKPDIKVICVYTYDSDDEQDVMRIRKELRSLGITKKISYKTDRATLQGKYQKYGHQKISKYYC